MDELEKCPFCGLMVVAPCDAPPPMPCQNVDDALVAAQLARKLKVTGAPERIWLNYGELEHDDTHANLADHGDVTWCEDQVFDSDVEYVRADVAAAQVAAERERWAPLLRAAGRTLQAFDDGYLQPDPETLQGGLAVDALREAWGTFVPARIRGA